MRHHSNLGLGGFLSKLFLLIFEEFIEDTICPLGLRILWGKMGPHIDAHEKGSEHLGDDSGHSQAFCQGIGEVARCKYDHVPAVGPVGKAARRGARGDGEPSAVGPGGGGGGYVLRSKYILCTDVLRT